MSEGETKLLHADLTYKIRGALFHVGNHLWPGLPEEDIQKAVSIGLTKRKIPHSTEEEFHVHYRGIEVGRYYCDIAVGRKVILELKVVPVLTGLHQAQIISYLRVSGADVGLLVNFGAPRVEIVAAFAVREMSAAFDVKMRRYLSHFDKKLGLLANFHGERLDVRPVRIP